MSSKKPTVPSLPSLAKVGHAAHCNRTLTALPQSHVDVDSSRLALVFYCLGTLDLLDMFQDTARGVDKESWREWIWEQQTGGRHGTGFKPGPYMTPQNADSDEEYNPPHLIMTYTALLTLAILRDDFSRLDRPGIVKLLRACQREDGSFSTVPDTSDSDLRTTYCAFAICSMLDDWSAVDVELAISYITKCRTYQGGYGQAPHCEAQGGTTYTALASLYLAPSPPIGPHGRMSTRDREQTIRWLTQNQDVNGGFRGRTAKEADACYCFWCGASLHILGERDLIDTRSLAEFVCSCQFKFGGIAKAPGEHPDPYHTYLALAALSMYPLGPEVTGANADSWTIKPLDPLLNATEETAKWVREHVPARHS